VIRFTKVSKHYPTGTGPALADLTFHVGRGEFVFLTGHSGAGKSSILKLMHAEERPSEGDIRVAGFATASLGRDEVPRLRRRLGIVFQDFRLLEDRTVAENIAFALEVTGSRADVIPARVARVLATRGVFQLLQDINAHGTVVVMATHNLELVRQAGHRVLELRDGRLVFDSHAETEGEE
jgi:cell division transport system ATP-binding protein